MFVLTEIECISHYAVKSVYLLNGGNSKYRVIDPRKSSVHWGFVAFMKRFSIPVELLWLEFGELGTHKVWKS